MCPGSPATLSTLTRVLHHLSACGFCSEPADAGLAEQAVGTQALHDAGIGGGGAVQPFSAAAPLSEMVTPGSTAYLGLLRHTFTPEWAETRAEGRETMLKDGE